MSSLSPTNLLVLCISLCTYSLSLSVCPYQIVGVSVDCIQTKNDAGVIAWKGDHLYFYGCSNYRIAELLDIFGDVHTITVRIDNDEVGGDALVSLINMRSIPHLELQCREMPDLRNLHVSTLEIYGMDRFDYKLVIPPNFLPLSIEQLSTSAENLTLYPGEVPLLTQLTFTYHGVISLDWLNAINPFVFRSLSMREAEADWESKYDQLYRLQEVETLKILGTKSAGFLMSWLSNLKILEVSCRRAFPLRALAARQNLVHLKLCTSSIDVDLSPLTELPLKYLELDFASELEDLSPLANIKTLETLIIPTSKVKDLTPLQTLPLKTLEVTHSEVISLKPLSHISTLANLNAGTKSGDWHTLAHHPGLEEVYVDYHDANEILEVALTWPKLKRLTGWALEEIDKTAMKDFKSKRPHVSIRP